jgi:hypothetical protein
MKTVLKKYAFFAKLVLFNKKKIPDLFPWLDNNEHKESCLFRLFFKSYEFPNSSLKLPIFKSIPNPPKP